MLRASTGGYMQLPFSRVLWAVENIVASQILTVLRCEFVIHAVANGAVAGRVLEMVENSFGVLHVESGNAMEIVVGEVIKNAG